MPRVEKLTKEQKAEILYIYKETLEPTQKIMQKFKVHIDHYKAFNAMLIQEFGMEFFQDRKTRCYAQSKLGAKNPYFNKPTPVARYEPVGDGNGYLMILKPDWYTGRSGSKYVFQHSVIMCEMLGITEIPRGFVVHHIDEDKTNNNINNLSMMTMSAHTKLHHLLNSKGAETI